MRLIKRIRPIFFVRNASYRRPRWRRCSLALSFRGIGVVHDGAEGVGGGEQLFFFGCEVGDFFSENIKKGELWVMRIIRRF
jgi:hypothetical protein